MQEVKFTQIASYTGLDQQVQRVRFYLLNPAFCLGPPANFIRFFAVFLLFYYNTGQRDCQGKIVYTFTFETYRHSAINKGDQRPPLQLFDSLLCRKIALLGVSSTLCWCSARFDSAIPHSSLTTVFS